jgi:hypothetical protein
MNTTLGIHLAITTHGTWLHGNRRGSWHRGKLLDSDPFLESAARAAMSHTAIVLDNNEQALVAKSFGDTVLENQYQVLAATI